MSKVILKGSLSRSSFQKLIKDLEKYKSDLRKGANLGVKEASLKFYNLVIAKMKNYNLSNHISEVKYEDLSTDKTQAYRVYTNDIVIMFHEFGTGIKGTDDTWANSFGYKVNDTGKGEAGWWYPTDLSDPNPHKWTDKSGQLRALTHGLTSKHIFYESLKEIEKDLAKEVQLKIDAQMSK